MLFRGPGCISAFRNRKLQQEWIDICCPFRAPQRGDNLDNFDVPNEMRVELGKLLGGNPVLQVMIGSGALDLVTREVLGLDGEAQYVTFVTGALVLCVPVARNLASIFDGEDRIEDGLLGRRGGKAFMPASRMRSSSFAPTGRKRVMVCIFRQAAVRRV